MFESAEIIFSQILILFAFIVIGYILKKADKLPSGFNKGISNLLVYILLPFLIFESMAKNFNMDIMAEKKNILIISVLLMLPVLLKCW